MYESQKVSARIGPQDGHALEWAMYGYELQCVASHQNKSFDEAHGLLCYIY